MKEHYLIIIWAGLKIYVTVDDANLNLGGYFMQVRNNMM